ncbi:MAG TPA: amino acid adenylation domain-containing protein [Blastocatellia bacterium]|nr:amino acid adenylation domain-containing protein [Blastocatellia bacterium]
MKMMSRGQGSAIEPFERAEEMPLSFSQQRLWFLDQLEKGNPSYNIPTAVRIAGRLDEEALERALNEVVKRHEVLRATFPVKDGLSRQEIAPFRPVPLPLVDLSGLPAVERRKRASMLANEEASRPFDLALGPLMRSTLIRIRAEEHLGLFTMHHIVSDGWSRGIFFTELVTIYDAYCRGKVSPLPELSIQYSDFARWQREWLQGELLDRQLSYWRKQLAGSLPVLELPIARPGLVARTHKGAVEPFSFPGNLHSGVRSFSRREGVTVFMTLLAAFEALLHRYTLLTDLIVGTPVAGRTRLETEPLIGIFVNTLALRTDLSGDPTFRQLAQRIKKVTWDAFSNQDVPFEKLVEELQPDRNLGRTPIFQALFAFQSGLNQRIQMPGLNCSIEATETGAAKFDLTFYVDETDAGLDGSLVFSADLFERVAIKRMVAHFLNLLRGGLANPDSPLSTLPLLAESEQRGLLVEWNQSRRELPPDLCIHQLFEEQAARTPGAVALVFKDEALTFGQLNRRANELAHYLTRLGVGPEVRVALCVDRSLDLLIGMLGILKAGGAYVPLDPTNPGDRIALLMDRSAAPILLTHRNLQLKSADAALRTIYLDEERDALAHESGENLRKIVSPECLAYVIFTSGSTGEPKGVGVEHRQVSNYVMGIVERLGIMPGSSFALVSAVAADLGNTVIFPALCAGGRLHIVPRASSFTGDELGEYLALSEVDYLKITPSHMIALQDSHHSGNLMPRGTLVLGGESSRWDWVERLMDRAPGCRVINHYGPTETTVGVLTFDAKGENRTARREIVPIGRPLANTQVFVLDDSLQPVPVGVVGELYIGGKGVARGYINAADLTAEKFIPDLFSKEPGTRLYKTGDLVRYLEDGSIEFVGRKDHQVKIRGFRVELEEIEAMLNSHPDVRESAVVTRENDRGDTSLIGYLVARSDQEGLQDEVRRFLRERLPEYMVPAVISTLPQFPLTPSGKIDRKALPDPDHALSPPSHNYVAPRDRVESLLASIWAEVLAVPIVGVFDNFFDLGGHSLLATQVTHRLREALDVAVPLRDLFEHPTIAALAAKLSGALSTGGRGAAIETAPALIPVPRDTGLPLSFSQLRLWFLDQLEPGSPLYNVPSAVRLAGRLDIGVLERSLKEIIRRHEALRTTFAVVNGEPRQFICADPALALTFVDLRELSEAGRSAEMSRLSRLEAGLPFDLERGPLVRAALIDLGESDHLLLVTLHHIVSDVWSRWVLMNEFARLYQAFKEGRPSPLQGLAIQYGDYAHWQRRWLDGEVLVEQLTYWRERLSGAPLVLEVSTRRPRPAVQSYRGDKFPIEIGDGLTQSLLRLSRDNGATLFMTLLSAFSALLHHYTGKDDLLIGVPIANRNRIEVESLIGFFVNTLVMRTDLTGDPTFESLLERVRQGALDSYAHQDLPFEKLVEEIQPERDLSRAPIFQVVFTLQNTPESKMELPGLTLNSIEIDSGTSKYDLVLDLWETDGKIKGHWHYSTDLFDEDEVRVISRRFDHLLRGIVAFPAARLSAQSMLCEEEMRLLDQKIDIACLETSFSI